MNLFKKIFKKKETEINPMQNYVQSDEVDNAWFLYGEGKITAPFKYLLDYVGGINGEGHNCFFDNNESELNDISFALKDYLPEDLFTAFSDALDAYRSDVKVTEKCDVADKLFYKREYDVMQVVERCAKEL